MMQKPKSASVMIQKIQSATLTLRKCFSMSVSQVAPFKSREKQQFVTLKLDIDDKIPMIEAVLKF